MSEPREGRAYLDHAASSPLRPEALEAMLCYLKTNFANPSGMHSESRRARRAVDDAREQIAQRLEVRPDEVYFTSGGTESNNLALGGAMGADGEALVVSSIEHHSVLEPARERKGLLAPVLSSGQVDLDALSELVGPHTALVSVMAVNNETGVVQPIEQIHELVCSKAPNARLHCDAVQAVPWIDLGPLTDACDLLSLSAHKFGGPKGVGVLVVRAKARPLLNPILRGGAQERDLRAGTENVAGIVATAVALGAALDAQDATRSRVARLRDRFYDEISASIDNVIEPAARELRIVSNAQVRFPGVEHEELLVLLDRFGVAASAGSACASGALEPSHVLIAMGYSPGEANETVRFSFGEDTTEQETMLAADGVVRAVRRLRGETSVSVRGDKE